MKIFGFKQVAGLILAATIAGAPVLGLSAAFAQPAPAATAPAAAAAPAADAAAAPADAAAAPAAAAEPEKPAVVLLPHQKELALDQGAAAWILTSTALVLLMTIPGLALFYGGMVRRKNVIATVAQSFAVTCLISVLWAVIGYSLSFGANPGTATHSEH